jgi:hypothetical protein
MHFSNATFPSAPTALMTPPDAWVDDEIVRNKILTDIPLSSRNSKWSAVDFYNGG